MLSLLASSEHMHSDLPLLPIQGVTPFLSRDFVSITTEFFTWFSPAMMNQPHELILNLVQRREL